MNKTELFIYFDGDWRKVDLGENISFPITYNIADVKDISKRNSSFTKTLNIPHTVNNSQLFNFIFDVHNLSDFNANKKVRCYVLNDTIQVFEGFFQLRNIKSGDNIHFNYECVILGDNDTFFETLSGGYISDLDFSELNHTYNYVNISDSWDKDWTYGYYYPLIDYNNNLDNLQLVNNDGLEIEKMRPGIYVKYIMEKLFNESGFTYESDFFDSEIFENLIIPYGAPETGPTPEWIFNNRIYIGLTGSYVCNPLSNVASQPFDYAFLMSDTGTPDYDPTMRFSNDLSPFGDPSGYWDVTNFEYTQPSQTFYIKFGVNLDIKINKLFQGKSEEDIPSVYPFPQVGRKLGGDIIFRILREFNPITGNPAPNGFEIPIANAEVVNIGEPVIQGSYVFLTNEAGSVPFGNGNTYNIVPFFTNDDIIDETVDYVRYKKQIQSIVLDGSATGLAPLYPGEKVWVEIDTFFVESFMNNYVRVENILNGENVFEVMEGSYITTDIESVLFSGQDIDMSRVLTPKIKKSDFVSSILKMFNLYVDIDKNNPKNLIIETRDDYYAKGVVKDWSRKLDISKEVRQQILGELRSKDILYTYKKDSKDYYNDVYFNSHNEIWGQYIKEIDNDFIKGEEKTEIIFSPSVCSYASFDLRMLIPRYLDKDNGDTTNNIIGGIRILQRGTQSISVPDNGFWKLDGNTLNTYPYAGHFNHPTQASSDINFGITKVLYYPGNQITNNNLYNVYHRKMIEEIVDKDSRLITANFYLDALDLNSLSFNDIIFVDRLSSSTGGYFRLNKIEYNPVRSGSYKVELLKIKEIDLKVIKGDVVDTFIKPMDGVIISRPNRPYTDKGILVGKGNTSREIGGVFIFGDSNEMGYFTNGFIYGDDNRIGANSFLSAVVGGNNHYIVSSNNAVILGGENNFIGKSATNSVVIGGAGNKIDLNIKNSVVIGGVNNTLRESDRVMIGQPMIKVSNFVGAGRDEVLSAFPENKVENFISGGRDEVRPLGSHTIENLLSGGYDFVI